MQLGFSFSLLLASLILFFSAFVEAIPVRRNAGLVTLPLKRLQQRTDVHPTILLQQHINRSHRRYARMTGRQEPSSEQLRQSLHKRFNRVGTALNQVSNHLDAPHRDAKSGDDCNATSTIILVPSGSMHVAKGGSIPSSTGIPVPSASSVGAGNGTMNNSTGAGFSQIDLNAQNNGGLTAAVQPTAPDSLGLDIEANDVGYIATVQLGTPPRNFKILMDSGSADFWVGAEGCQSQAGACGNHTFLGTQSSSSFVDTGKPFNVTYGTGAVAGNIVTDNLAMAGLILNNHTFGVATLETIDFASSSVPFDGLMGFAKSTLSNQMVPTPVEALASNKLINSAVSSFKISRLSDQKNDGEVTLGGLDQTKFVASTLTTFANVNKLGFWEGAMSLAVNGQSLGLQGRTAILDTGTTLIIAPPQDAAAIHAAIPGSQSDGQGGFTLPCTTTAVVAMTFGNTSFPINPSDLLFAPVDPKNLTGTCVSGISSGQIGAATEWLVGDVFLKNAYFSTDVAKNQISLAKLA